MANTIPYPLFTKSFLDEETARTTLRVIQFINYIPENDKIIIKQEEPIDNFDYPTLQELRQQFKATGRYNNEQLDKIVAAYERLPKYKSASDSGSRGRKRS